MVCTKGRNAVDVKGLSLVGGSLDFGVDPGVGRRDEQVAWELGEKKETNEIHPTPEKKKRRRVVVDCFSLDDA